MTDKSLKCTTHPHPPRLYIGACHNIKPLNDFMWLVMLVLICKYADLRPDVSEVTTDSIAASTGECDSQSQVGMLNLHLQSCMFPILGFNFAVYYPARAARAG